MNTIIQNLGKYNNNHLWVKREDLIPFSFGGNKARKAQLFFQEINQGDYDCVVTYGSGGSNHCRVIANECYRRGMDCYIISPEETNRWTFNRQMMDMFQAKITTVPVREVHDTIERKISELQKSGKKPYFIEGGGHGNIGTEAYVQCYAEIRDYEEQNNIYFEYIFLASGTGTTQAGLVCGQLLHDDKRVIIGISIARKNPYGREIVIDSVSSYMTSKGTNIDGHEMESKVIFLDDFIGDGYGRKNPQILQTAKDIMIGYGIPLDSTYTAKSFWGMKQYIIQKNIKDQNILFIHTGGTPLYFDDIKQM